MEENDESGIGEYWHDVPGSIVSRGLIPALENVNSAARALYAFTGGDDPQLARDALRVKQLIDDLRRFHA